MWPGPSWALRSARRRGPDPSGELGDLGGEHHPPPVGTGPRPTEEQSPIGDCRERGRTAAERAAVEPPALAVEDEVAQARPPGRRQLGTGVPASTFGPSFEGGF